MCNEGAAHNSYSAADFLLKICKGSRFKKLAVTGTFEEPENLEYPENLVKPVSGASGCLC